MMRPLDVNFGVLLLLLLSLIIEYDKTESLINKK